MICPQQRGDSVVYTEAYSDSPTSSSFYYPQDLLTEAYDKIDLDDNGDIEFDEFSTGMHNLNVSLTEDEVKEVFNLMDSDSSNFVDRTEFIMFLTQRFESNELRRFQDAILSKVRVHCTVYTPSNSYWFQFPFLSPFKLQLTSNLRYLTRKSWCF